MFFPYTHRSVWTVPVSHWPQTSGSRSLCRQAVEGYCGSAGRCFVAQIALCWVPTIWERRRAPGWAGECRAFWKRKSDVRSWQAGVIGGDPLLESLRGMTESGARREPQGDGVSLGREEAAERCRETWLSDLEKFLTLSFFLQRCLQE